MTELYHELIAEYDRVIAEARSFLRWMVVIVCGFVLLSVLTVSAYVWTFWGDG